MIFSTKIKKSILAIGIIGASFTGVAQVSPIKSLLTPKVARASLSISCSCAFWGGNQNCAANNGGSQCAPEGTTNCSSFHSNCEG